MAMAGDKCFVVICDKRLGEQMHTVSMQHSKIFEINPHLYLGMCGLATDALTVFQRMRFNINMYELKENRRISPQAAASLFSNFLYQHRFGPYYVSSILAGLGGYKSTIR